MSLAQFLDGFSERDWQKKERGTIRFAMVGMGWWTTEEEILAAEESEFCEITVTVSSSVSDPAEVSGTDIEHAIDYFARCLLTETDPAPDGEHGTVDIVRSRPPTNPRKSASASISDGILSVVTV